MFKCFVFAAVVLVCMVAAGQEVTPAPSPAMERAGQQRQNVQQQMVYPVVIRYQGPVRRLLFGPRWVAVPYYPAYTLVPVQGQGYLIIR